MAIKLHIYSFVESDASWTIEQAWECIRGTGFEDFKGVYFENQPNFAEFSDYISKSYGVVAVALNQLVTLSAISNSLAAGDYIFIVSRQYLEHMRTEVPTTAMIESDDWRRTILSIPIESLNSNAMDLLSLNSLRKTLDSEISKNAISNKKMQQEIESELAVELGRVEENMKNWPQILSGSDSTPETGKVNVENLIKGIGKVRKRTSNMIQKLEENPEIFELNQMPGILNPRVLQKDMIDISIELNEEGTKAIMHVKNNTQYYFPNAFLHEQRSDSILVPKKNDPIANPGCQPYYPREIKPYEEFMVKLQSPLIIMEEIQEKNRNEGKNKNFRLLKYCILFNSEVISNTFEVGACKISRHKKNPFKFNLHYSLDKKINGNLSIVQTEENKILYTKQVKLSRYNNDSVNIGDNIPPDQKVYLAVFADGSRISSIFNIN